MSQPAYQGPPPSVIYVTTQQEQQTTVVASKPQSLSLSAGGIIFVSAGMNLALSVGWFQYSVSSSPKQFCYSWFIGVIIGAIISAPLVNYIPKKFIMAFSTLLILIGGILFTSVPNNYDALLAGRYFNGIGIGLATVAYLMNASEIADSTNRGSCLAIEQYSVTFGMAIQMIYTSYWSYSLDFSVNRLHGIIDIVYAIIAGIFLLLFIESPIEYIRKDDDAAAMDCLSRLRMPKGVTMETRALFEQHKSYVREQENLSLSQSLSQGFLPVIKMIFFRSMMLAFCYSLPLNAALQSSMIINSTSWAPTLAGCLRVVGAIIALCLVDNVGRKLPSLISMLIIGALLIGLSTLFQSIFNLLDSSDMYAAMSLYVVIQFFAGFFTPYTSVYVGEAFPLRVKTFLLVVTVVVEQIIQIIMIATVTVNLYKCLLAQGIIMVVAFVSLCLTMPETKKTSLSEAQSRFRTLAYTKIN